MMSFKRSFDAFLRGSRGAAAVEFSLLVPVLAGLLLGAKAAGACAWGLLAGADYNARTTFVNDV